MTLPTWLLIDAGNTRIKWALMTSEGAKVSVPEGGFAWRVRGDCLTSRVADLTGGLLSAVRDPDCGHDIRAVYCSVAGQEVNAKIEKQLAEVMPNGAAAVRRFISTARVGPLVNGYSRPEQLGADRLAAALGAWHRTHGDAVVVCAGTATTVDILRKSGDEKCRFSGGIILPGLELMMRSLARQTAGLPDAAGDFQILPDNTDDAITSGCLQAQVGAIERMRCLVAAGVPCLLAGGSAGALRSLVSDPVIDAPDLVLEGLAAAILHGFDQ